MENVATFVWGVFVCFHQISAERVLRTSSTVVLAVGFLKQLFYVPVYLDMPSYNCKAKPLSVDLSSFGRNFDLSVRGITNRWFSLSRNEKINRKLFSGLSQEILIL